MLKNNQALLKTIRKESPEAYYEWTLNGIFVKPEPDRITFDGDNIQMRNLKSSDSGLYVCMLYRINKKRVVIRVISVAVKSKNFDVVTRATRSYTLLCNAIILGNMDLSCSLKLSYNSQTLLTKDKVIKNYSRG